VAIRTDITVNFLVSPRLIEVAAPSVEVTIQDLYDTLREIEDDVQNLDDDFLISAGGKEPLGGGVLVGVTAELNNAQLLFETRRIVLESGTITGSGSPEIGSPTLGLGSPPLTGTIANDSTATFISNGVSRGDLIFNISDQSSSEILTADSETQITARGLAGGTTNVFQTGDLYVIYDVIQCNIAGGNLVAISAAGAGSPLLTPELDPVFTTFGTQIVRTASSSATLQDLDALKFASFGGAVHLDTSSLFAGTVYPVGTEQRKVNNWSDAHTIAIDRGLSIIHIHRDETISIGLDFTEFRFLGDSFAHTLTVPVGATVTDAAYEFITVTGAVDGISEFSRCVIDNVSGFTGTALACGFKNTTTLGHGSHNIINGYSLVAGGGAAQTPVFDFGNGSPIVPGTHLLLIRNWTGGIAIRNLLIGGSPESTVSIDMLSGQVVIEDSVTSPITLRGVGKWTNATTYAGGAVITNELLESATLNAAAGSPQSGLTVASIVSGVWNELITGSPQPYPTGSAGGVLKLVSETSGLTTDQVASAVWSARSDDFSGSPIIGSPTTMGAQLTLVTSKACDIFTLVQTLLKFQANRTVLDKTAFTLTIYDNDNVTPIRVFDLRELGVGPSITEITERLPASGSPLTP